MLKHADVVRELISAKADVNARSHGGDTALMLASHGAYHDPVVVEELLKAGAEVDAVDDLGSTALMEACGQAREQAVRVLLQAGANVALTNKKGRSALHMAKTNPFAAAIVNLLLTPPTKVAGHAAATARPASGSGSQSDIKQVVWSVVSPLQTTLQDPNKIVALGPACIPAVVDVFLHPKEPSTGIACNQAVLYCVLDIFAREGNQEAASFLHRIANDEVDLFDNWGQTAYEMAKAFASDNPLPIRGKAETLSPSTRQFQCTYPEWMVVPDHARILTIDGDCEVLPWETFAYPKCSTRFGNLPSGGAGVKYAFNYGMRGISGGTPQSFAKVWWTEVRCCGQKYLVSNRGT